MGIEFVPALKDLQLETRQVRTLRIGIWLLAAYLGIQLLLLIVTVLFAAGPTKPAEDAPAVEAPGPPWVAFAVNVGILLATCVPGGVLHWRAGRTARWRNAAMALLVTILLQVALQLAIVIHFGSADFNKLPWEARLLRSCLDFLSMLEFWWIAILIAEFGAACRATPLLEQTERLGYVVLGALVAAALFGVWTIPAPPDPEDSVSAVLILTVVFVNVLLLVWTFRLLMISAMLSRFILDRISAAEQQLAVKDEDAEGK